MEAVAAMQKLMAWRQLHFDIINTGGIAGLPVRLTPYREDVPYGPLAPPLLASWAAEAAVVRAGWAAEASAAWDAEASAAADDLELTTNSEGEHVPRHPRRARARRATASGHGKK